MRHARKIAKTTSIKRWRPWLEVLEDRTVPSTLTQITDTDNGDNDNASINGDGTRIAFQTDSNQLGSNADGNFEIFVSDTVSDQLIQITDTDNGDNTNPSINADGTRIAFQSDSNQLGNNADGNFEIFVFDISAGQLTQITDTDNGNNFTPSINADGTRVAFQSNSNQLGNNADGNFEIYVFDISAGQLIQITDTDNGDGENPSINGDGTRVAFPSNSNQLGNNADGNTEIYLFDTSADQLTQITETDNGDSFRLSINRDGTRIGFESNSNQLGDNADGNTEIYVFDTSTGQLIQVTDTDNGGSTNADISGDGTSIAFSSSSNQLGSNADNNVEIYLFDTRNSQLTQVTDTTNGNNFKPSINGDGTRMAFESNSNQLGSNADGNFEIFVFDTLDRDVPLVIGSGTNISPPAVGFQPPGTMAFSITPFPGFFGEVRVATGDVNGDGVPDIITAAGPGGGPHVRVFDGVTRNVIRDFFAYDVNFPNGVYVAAADVDNDGRADIVTGPGPGGGPHVKVFSGQTGAEIRSFFAYAPAFPGGVRIAAGDTNGDGFAEIITGAGPGGGPHVKVFDGKTNAETSSFFAFAPTFANGIFVAAGDMNRDGLADILIGAGPGGGPHVRGFSGLNPSNELVNFFAYNPAFIGGVRVAVKDVNGDLVPEIITGTGAGGGPHVKTFNPQTLEELDNFFGLDPAFTGGVFVS